MKFTTEKKNTKETEIPFELTSEKETNLQMQIFVRMSEGKVCRSTFADMRGYRSPVILRN